MNKILNTKYCYFLILFLIINCSKKNDSDSQTKIEFYEYIGDVYFPTKDTIENEVRFSEFDSKKINPKNYQNLTKYNYKLTERNLLSKKVESILFLNLENVKKSIPNYKCPRDFNNIILLKRNDSLKFICKFNEFCGEYYIYDIEKKTTKFKKLHFKKIKSSK